jgi:disulfide bond formation protein DsbB
LFAASASGGLASMAAASGAPIFNDAPVVPTSLPWWIKIAVVVLICSIAYTAASLRDTPRLANLAILGGVLVAVSEMRWLPGGNTVEYVAIAAGIVPLLFGPLLAKADLAKEIRLEIRFLVGILSLLAIGIAFGLQFTQGWSPCPLCWLERGALLGIAIGVLAGIDRLLFASLIGGLAVSMAQVIEMDHASKSLAHVCTLLAAGGPRCGVAGARVLVFGPVGTETAALFVLLWAASFWILRRFFVGAGK